MTSETSTAPTQIFPLVRHLSYRLTPILLKTSITPNQITAVSLFFGLLCAACFISGNHIAGIIGAIFMTASYTFDNCYGEVAQLKTCLLSLAQNLMTWRIGWSMPASLRL